MAAGLERIEDDQPDRPILFVDDILDETVGMRHFGKEFPEIFAIVMIAHARPDREWALAKGGFESTITIGIALIGKIARREQQIGPRLHVAKAMEDLIEAAPVELSRIIRIETQMNIRNLRNQHGRRSSLLTMQTPLFASWPPTGFSGLPAD
jgi:hypothetical protein